MLLYNVEDNDYLIHLQTNPPYYVPLVELLPSPWADKDVLTKTRDLMNKIGQVPIVIKKQKDGLVLNRLQNAIFKECFDLFRVCYLKTNRYEI